MFQKKDRNEEPQICGNCGHGKSKRRLRGRIRLLKCKPREELVKEDSPCLFKPSCWKPKENNPGNRLSKKEKRRQQRKEKKKKKKPNNGHRNRDQRRYSSRTRRGPR